MKYNIKKETSEDRFARKYWCKRAKRNFFPYEKKSNRKKFRRILKKRLYDEKSNQSFLLEFYLVLLLSNSMSTK